jgi:Cdc6-like AAA superfamily ATPase
MPRLKQSDQLRKLLGQAYPPQCIFVTGISGTGKTTTVRAILDDLSSTHLTAFIDCTKIQHSAGLLYQHILHQISSKLPANGTDDRFSCTDGGLVEMVDRLQSLLADTESRPVIIVRGFILVD